MPALAGGFAGTLRPQLGSKLFAEDADRLVTPIHVATRSGETKDLLDCVQKVVPRLEGSAPLHDLGIVPAVEDDRVDRVQAKVAYAGQDRAVGPKGAESITGRGRRVAGFRSRVSTRIHRGERIARRGCERRRGSRRERRRRELALERIPAGSRFLEVAGVQRSSDPPSVDDALEIPDRATLDEVSAIATPGRHQPRSADQGRTRRF